MNSDNPNSFLNAFGIRAMSYGEVMTSLFLKISISLFLTVFSARSKGPFWLRVPGKLLFASSFGSMLTITLMCVLWPYDYHALNSEKYQLMKPISMRIAVFTWIYDIVFFFIQDLLKYLMITGFESYYTIKTKDKKFYPPVMIDTFSHMKEERKKSIVTQRSLIAANEPVRPFTLRS